jgi:hypothetical protein
MVAFGFTNSNSLSSLIAVFLLVKNIIRESMYAGYVFLCNNASLKECVGQKRLSCPSEQSINQEVGIDSLVFLFNKDSDTLVGPFTVVSSARTGLEPGTWTQDIDRHSLSGNVMVEWEELHEMKNAQLKFPFLKSRETCKLGHFQTQDLLNALKKEPLFHEK